MRTVPDRLVYAVALCIGVCAAVATLPLATMLGTGALWVMPGGDPAMGLTGHLAFQQSGWHWPLLLADRLAWPAGRSIAMTDSNPLVSLIAKLVAGIVGHPVNLLGAWLVVCWVLQPVAAVYALRGFGPSRSPAGAWIAAIGVAVLSLLCPAWLLRFTHLNLLGHFLLLGALGLAVRLVRAPRGALWWSAGVLLTVAVLTHPYVFVYSAIVLATPLLHAVLQARGAQWSSLASISRPGTSQAGKLQVSTSHAGTGRAGIGRAGTGRGRHGCIGCVALRYGAVCVAPVLLLWVLSGSLGATASGYGHYSMNLLSPVVPQLSGLFGATLPIIDATGGQYEGFNYQGGGVLLLLVVVGAVLAWRSPRAGLPSRDVALALGVPLLALTALALSPHVYAGHWLVLNLPLWPWRRLAASVQSSGRAFWVVGYAIMVGAVAWSAARLRPVGLGAVLIAAIVLQGIDTAPMRARAAGFFAGRNQQAPAFAIPHGATLLRVVPACDKVTATADLLRLAAVRQGLRLADIRMARQPDGFDCETALADGLEAPLARDEVRFFLPEAVPALRQEALGTGADCRREAAGVLCTRDEANPLAATPAPVGAPVPVLVPGVAAAGEALTPYLSFGWARDGKQTAWSEGPQSTLLFRLPAGTAGSFTLVLAFDGVAQSAGGVREISVRIDDGPARTLALADLRRAEVALPLPSSLTPGAVRIVFQVRRPVAPEKRHLAAPVRRAGVRLYAISLRQDG